MIKYVITLYCAKTDTFEIEVYECYGYWELLKQIETLVEYYSSRHNAEIEIISITKL